MGMNKKYGLRMGHIYNDIDGVTVDRLVRLDIAKYQAGDLLLLE
jgi:hypothetical protein